MVSDRVMGLAFGDDGQLYGTDFVNATRSIAYRFVPHTNCGTFGTWKTKDPAVSEPTLKRPPAPVSYPRASPSRLRR
jgi:hypothetical protein